MGIDGYLVISLDEFWHLSIDIPSIETVATKKIILFLTAWSYYVDLIYVRFTCLRINCFCIYINLDYFYDDRHGFKRKKCDERST